MTLGKLVNLSGPQLAVLAKRENKAPSRGGTVKLKPTMDEEGLHIEDAQQRTHLLPQPRASDIRLGHVPTSLALELGAESCEFLFLRWELSGQLSISIPGKFRESKGLYRSHNTLTQGPGLPRRTSGLSSEPFNRRLFQSLLHMPGGCPTSQSHPFPTWAYARGVSHFPKSPLPNLGSWRCTQVAQFSPSAPSWLGWIWPCPGRLGA